MIMVGDKGSNVISMTAFILRKLGEKDTPLMERMEMFHKNMTFEAYIEMRENEDLGFDDAS
jgi:hypothetical protein